VATGVDGSGAAVVGVDGSGKLCGHRWLVWRRSGKLEDGGDARGRRRRSGRMRRCLGKLGGGGARGGAAATAARRIRPAATIGVGEFLCAGGFDWVSMRRFLLSVE
jgi:hypothetical protein